MAITTHLQTWRKRHPEAARAAYRVYGNMRRNHFYRMYWPQIVEHYGPCVRCRYELRQTPTTATCTDHVISALDDPERYNVLSNLQPLCRSCNSRKGRWTEDYRPDKGAWITQLVAQGEMPERAAGPLHRFNQSVPIVPGRCEAVAMSGARPTKPPKRPRSQTPAALATAKHRAKRRGVPFDPNEPPYTYRSPADKRYHPVMVSHTPPT